MLSRSSSGLSPSTVRGSAAHLPVQRNCVRKCFRFAIISFCFYEKHNCQILTSVGFSKRVIAIWCCCSFVLLLIFITLHELQYPFRDHCLISSRSPSWTIETSSYWTIQDISKDVLKHRKNLKHSVSVDEKYLMQKWRIKYMVCTTVINQAVSA